MCVCLKGWSGIECQYDINECDFQPCKHGGICINSNGDYNCICDIGWSGANCELDIDECLTLSCSHGSECINYQGGFTCNCTNGWTGIRCDENINECKLKNICANGASCYDTDGSYYCNCSVGWKGQNCDIDINECLINTCQNNATCQNIDGSFLCLCGSEWTGEFCQSSMVTNVTSEVKSQTQNTDAHYLVAENTTDNLDTHSIGIQNLETATKDFKTQSQQKQYMSSESTVTSDLYTKDTPKQDLSTTFTAIPLIQTQDTTKQNLVSRSIVTTVGKTKNQEKHLVTGLTTSKKSHTNVPTLTSIGTYKMTGKRNFCYFVLLNNTSVYTVKNMDTTCHCEGIPLTMSFSPSSQVSSTIP